VQQQTEITIAIPTFRRPDGIGRALDSVEALQVPPELSANVLVVDNDEQASAKPVVEKFSKQSHFPVTYVVEPKQGLSNVRNRILQEAMNLKAEYLAGIDDDEIATSDWLIQLWRGLKKFDADCVGGPQLFILPEDAPGWMRYAPAFNPYAKRKTGKIVPEISTGNYLLNLDFVRAKTLTFSAKYNFIGGEDSDFFTRCRKKGAKIVWIKEAIATEYVPKERTKLKWVLRRNYRIGYGMVSVQKKKGLSVFLKSLTKILYYPAFCFLSFVFFRKQKGFRFFFRFFYHLGRLGACVGISPYKEYNKP